MVKSSIQLFSSFLIIVLISSSAGLKCFQCISRNSGNRPCEQPTDYATDCYIRSAFGTQEAGKYCVAMRTVNPATREPVLIRTCTSERPPNCGRVNYEFESFEGCPLSCSFDGCNGGEPPAMSYQSGQGSSMMTSTQYGVPNQPYNQYPNQAPGVQYGQNPYGQNPYGQQPGGNPPYGGYDQYPGSRGHPRATSAINSMFSLARSLVTLFFLKKN